MGEESRIFTASFNYIDSFVFKVYVKDQRRIEQVQEMMDGLEIGSINIDRIDNK